PRSNDDTGCRPPDAGGSRQAVHQSVPVPPRSGRAESPPVRAGRGHAPAIANVPRALSQTPFRPPPAHAPASALVAGYLSGTIRPTRHEPALPPPPPPLRAARGRC